MKKFWLIVVRHKAIFAAIILFLYVGAAQLIYQQHQKSVQAEQAVTSGKTTFVYACSKTSDPESILCLEKQYQEATQKDGVQAAFTKLEAAYKTDPNVQSDCHQLAHVIGRTAADAASNVDEAYSQGNNFCWSGYYHGVIESIVSRIGPAALPGQIPTICAQIKEQKPYSFYHYNCVHGLGHGVMDVTHGDLFASLDICAKLSDSWEAQSCYGGVFMQNVMNELDSGHGKPLFKADDPMYPCDAVADLYKEQCYLMQTSHALHVQNEDFAKVFADCDGVEVKYRDTCYQSLGRDSSGNSNSAIGPTVANCMLGKNYDAQSNCFVGAVKDYISYFHSDKQADQLCKALQPDLQNICEMTKTQYYATF